MGGAGMELSIPAPLYVQDRAGGQHDFALAKAMMAALLPQPWHTISVRIIEFIDV